MKQEEWFGGAWSGTVNGKVQLRDNYMASICKNYHKEMAH